MACHAADKRRRRYSSIRVRRHERINRTFYLSSESVAASSPYSTSNALQIDDMNVMIDSDQLTSRVAFSTAQDMQRLGISAIIKEPLGPATGAYDTASAPSRLPPASPSTGLRPPRSPCPRGKSTFIGFFDHSPWCCPRSPAHLCGVVLVWQDRVVPQHGGRAPLRHAGEWQVTVNHTVLHEALR